MNSLTQEKLKEILHYDESTGEFTWLSKSSKYRKDMVGKQAGSPGANGRVKIKISGKPYQAHRLAWLYVYGVMPEKSIDHINRIHTDNRIANLRLVTHAENCQNRYSRSDSLIKFQGVDFMKRESVYRARITIKGKTITLGYFKTADEAYSAYKQAAAVMHTHNPHGVQSVEMGRRLGVSSVAERDEVAF